MTSAPLPTRPSCRHFALLTLLAFAALTIPTPKANAQATATLTTLHSFAGTLDGEYPDAALLLATNGNLYGTTSSGGGTSGDGTIFSLTPAGVLTTIYSFTGGADGAAPEAALIQAADGNLYGTTAAGGAYGAGTVFQLTPAGVLTTVYAFTGNGDGGNPSAALVQGTDGNFYGTTYNGGTADGGGTSENGTIFELTVVGTVGTLTTLHNFQGPDGANPSAALVQGPNGRFYGTTSSGGVDGDGSIFSIGPNGDFNRLHSFADTNFATTSTALILASDGNFYGTADTAVFEITPDGNFSKLYDFGQYSPVPSSLVQASDGNLYGTTIFGGPDGVGSIFQLQLSGGLTTIHNFTAAEGNYPETALVEDGAGELYGTTVEGGASGDGTVFRIIASPTITSATSATAVLDAPFTFQVTATNNPTSFAAANLPANLSINPTTGLISGTPAQSGVFKVLVGATNAGGTDPIVLTLTVIVAPPVITSATSASVQAGTRFTYQIIATNAPTAYTADGLPSGLSLDPNTGVIAGSSNAAPGTYPITLIASNSSGSGTATLNLTITAAAVAAPVIASATTDSAPTGQSFTYQIIASNSPTSFSATGLPAGLTLSSGGLISGTPTVAGTFQVALAATNAAGTGTTTLTLTLAPALTLPTVTLTAATPLVTAGTGEDGAFMLTRSGTDLSAQLMINYTVRGSAINGSDYVELSGVRKMRAGKSSVKIKVVPIGDGAGTGVKRSVTLVLAPGNGYTVGTTGKVKVRIVGQ